MYLLFLNLALNLNKKCLEYYCNYKFSGIKFKNFFYGFIDVLILLFKVFYVCIILIKKNKKINKIENF